MSIIGHIAYPIQPFFHHFNIIGTQCTYEISQWRNLPYSNQSKMGKKMLLCHSLKVRRVTGQAGSSAHMASGPRLFLGFSATAMVLYLPVWLELVPSHE